MINDILVGGFLPNFKYFLSEEDPIPIFAIKLLSALTDRSEHFVTSINKLGILPHIIEFYSYGHKRMNPHTKNVIRKVMDPEAPMDSVFGGIFKNQ